MSYIASVERDTGQHTVRCIVSAPLTPGGSSSTRPENQSPSLERPETNREFPPKVHHETLFASGGSLFPLCDPDA